MRTTVNIDDHLLDQARLLAAASRRPLGDIVDDALRVFISSRAGAEPRRPVDLPVYGGSGLRPGVDLEDKDALADLLDQPAGDRAPG